MKHQIGKYNWREMTILRLVCLDELWFGENLSLLSTFFIPLLATSCHYLFSILLLLSTGVCLPQILHSRVSFSWMNLKRKSKAWMHTHRKLCKVNLCWKSNSSLCNLASHLSAFKYAFCKHYFGFTCFRTTCILYMCNVEIKRNIYHMLLVN